MTTDPFRYDGKRALVVGGATGMGAATAELVQRLGGDVVVMDVAEVTRPGVRAIELDLRDRDGIDRALDECGGPIDALFAAAGAADGTPGIEMINFIGHRHLIERALASGLLPPGSAVGLISSTAGLAWEKNVEKVRDYLATPDFDSAVAWIAEHPGTADYMWSKQAMCGYVALESFRFLRHGVRLNAIMPGPTDTPLARSQEDLWLGFGADFRDAVGRAASTPEEQAGPLVFLCSDAAAYVNGVTLISDLGYVTAGTIGSFEPAVPVVDFLRNV